RRYKEDDLWAYRPLRTPAVPANGAAHPIDAFLQARRLARQVHQTAPPADRPTLLRRLAFDLTGLPPSLVEMERFLDDGNPYAFSRAIDRLLASPHYGEQQARHWLDVVRYADTSGFANDFERPNVWRYRDYVVRS